MKQPLHKFGIGLLSGLSKLLRKPISNKDRRMLAKAFLTIELRARKARKAGVLDTTPLQILGGIVHHYNISTVRFLFTEIFSDEQYAIDPRTEAPNIIDCGSNVGMAVLYFKWKFPDAKILAFEPFPDAFQALQANVTANALSNVTVRQQAVWREPGKLELFVPRKPGSTKMSLKDGRAESLPISVDTIRLADHIVAPVDLLKIDIEGAEIEVLEDIASAGKLALVQEMIIEYHHLPPRDKGRLSRLLRILEKNSFAYELTGAKGTRPMAQEDILIRAQRGAQTPTPPVSG